MEEQAEAVEQTSDQAVSDPGIKVGGMVMTDLPTDLYIPPEALEVFLDMFQGPLDLLLYLIKKQNLDILDIPIAQITHQYMGYVDMMRSVRLDLASDYLVMAAALAQIKSRMLLPRSDTGEEAEEEDPRAELVRRLQEYERFKKAATGIEALPQVGRDTFLGLVLPPDRPAPEKPNLDMAELMTAFSAVIKRMDLNSHHAIQQEPLSVRERMAAILAKVNHLKFVDFSAFFTPEEGRIGVVVTFIAILELLKESLIDIAQTEEFGPIYIKAVQLEGEENASSGPYH